MVVATGVNGAGEEVLIVESRERIAHGEGFVDHIGDMTRALSMGITKKGGRSLLNGLSKCQSTLAPLPMPDPGLRTSTRNHVD